MLTGWFKDPTSRTGWSFINEKGSYADAKPPARGAKVIENPFAGGQRRRSKDQMPTAPPARGYAWKFRNGAWVQVKDNQKQLTPGAGGLFPVPQPAQPAPKPNPPAPTPPPAATLPTPPLPGIDPRDAVFFGNVGVLGHTRDTGVAALEAERLANRGTADTMGRYDKSYADLMQNFLRRRYSGNAALASRGAVRSGGYQRHTLRNDATRLEDVDAADRLYGQKRGDELTSQQRALESQYHLSRVAEYAAAMDRYKRDNPASNYVFKALEG